MAVEKTGLSQVEFARQAKIKPRTLQDVLGGQSANPEMSTLQGISERSGVSIDELVFGMDSTQKSKKEDFTSAVVFLQAYQDSSLDMQKAVRACLFPLESAKLLSEMSAQGLRDLIKLVSSATRPK